MDIQDQTTPSGHTCRSCGWPFPNPHPTSKHRRAHKTICGTIEGYTNLIIDSEPVSDDEHHSGSGSDDDDDDEPKEKTPSPKIEKRIIKESGSSAGGIEEKSNRSEDDTFSDAVTEFSDTGISPGVVSKVKKVDEHSEVFESPITHFKDTDKIEEHGLNTVPDSDTKHSVPLVEESDGSHEDKVIDQMELSNTGQTDNKDQGKDVYTLSVPSDIPLVDKAETLIEDFKDHKTMYSNVSRDDKQAENRSMVDIFEVKTVQENVDESQTSEHEESTFVPTVIEEDKVAKTQPLEMSKTAPESADNLSEVEVSHDKHSVVTLGERMEAEMKEAEIDHSVPVLPEVCTQETIIEPKSGVEVKPKIVESVVSDSKDSVKVGTSETLVNESSGKLLSGQDCGVDASFGSSSRNSLEGNWGSVSEFSDAFGKSELSDDRSRLGRSDAFAGPSLVESEQESIEQTASKIKQVKVQKSQPEKSEANVGNETEGRKRNEAIAKVANWSTSEHISTTPLRKLISEAKPSNPKQLPSRIQKDKDAEKPNEPGRSNLTQETKTVNQESSPVKHSGEDKNDKKKTKGIASWVRFVCCSTSIKR